MPHRPRFYLRWCVVGAAARAFCVTPGSLRNFEGARVLCVSRHPH